MLELRVLNFELLSLSFFGGGGRVWWERGYQGRPVN